MDVIDGITFRRLEAGNRIPGLAEPQAPDLDLVAWARDHREALDSKLDEYGAVLFRGFAVADQQHFQEFSGAAGELLEYVYRSTARTTVGDKVYTSTEYPPSATIPMHCENAYQRDWPTKLFFFCDQPAESGGRTPLADIAGVTARIEPTVREKFQEKKVMYVRNYTAGPGIDLSWQTVFQTEDPGEVETYCREHDIEHEWRPGNTLRTRQVCQAMATHPRSGELLWFNQAHLFHSSSLDAKTREALLAFYKEEDLSRSAFYGDGSPLEPDVLEAIRQAYAEQTTSFPWQRGDVLVVDNMAVAHGRTPFEGQRRILVTMADTYSSVTGSGG